MTTHLKNLLGISEYMSNSVIIMTTLKTAFICTLFGAAWSDLVFPPGFKFGSASSAYQVEGGWNASDKGVSNWDHYLHSNPSVIRDGTNGDVACDSYHQWRRDIEIAAELGLNFYRFSISWSRLLPNGFANYISEDGKSYYSNLIDGLLEKGIEPLVTIFQFDMPQNLQDLGGWTNPLIADWFADYTRVVYSLFANRVNTWITINEPAAICDLGYMTGALAPGVIDYNVGVYLCTKNILLAHAKAWRVYDEEFKPKYNGKVSICNHLLWFEPATEQDEDIAELALDYSVGRYSHPIYSKEGGWPPAIEEVINDYGIKHGYTRPRLPPFTEEEIQLIKGTYDYFGFNHYTSRVARHAQPEETVSFFLLEGIAEINAVMEKHPNWTQGSADILYDYPEGIRKQISSIKEKYGAMEYIITENGYSSTGDMEDKDRIKYMHDYLEQIWLSIHEDGANVTGYTYWSMMDSFEWTNTEEKFGLYAVDFTSPERTRTSRASAHYYATIIQNHALHKPSYL